VFGTCGRFDVIHNVNVNVTEDNTGLCCARFPDNVTENDSRFGGRHLVVSKYRGYYNEYKRTFMDVLTLWKL